MNKLDEYSQLIGRTIERVAEVDNKQVLVFVFDDGDYAVVSKTYRCEDIALLLTEDLEDFEMRAAGLITDYEYKEIKRIEKENHNKRIKDRELQQLHDLKLKYEGDE